MVKIYILLFFSYAILGWIMEVILKYFQYKRFINRGFLIGPYCPIYGWGAILITILLKKYYSDPLALFVFAILICSILEYLTSYIMEKIFHARWWDYSTKKFNINGRICLNTMIPFGMLGLLMMYIINPFLVKIFNTFSNNTLMIIIVILSSIFIVDNIISLLALSKVRDTISNFRKDNTEEISLKVRKMLSKLAWPEQRIIKAFPKLHYLGNIKENIKEVKNTLETKQNKLKMESEIKIKLLKEEYDYKINEIKDNYTQKIKKITKK